MFYDNFLSLCKLRGVTPTRVARDIEIRQSTVSMWKNQGTTPKYETLQKIAKYFNVTTDYLLGYETSREIIPERLTIIETDLPGAKNIRYAINATDAEAYQIGLQIFQRAGISPVDYSPSARLNAAFNELNPTGQQVAVERIEELTKIPNYQKEKDPSQPE